MAFRLYKEGQGAKARNTLAFVVGGTGLFASVSVYEYLRSKIQGSFFKIPLFNWSVSVPSIVAILVLGVFVVAGIWLYNQPKLSDFLIDTETELKTKVTWPTKKETLNNSIVVVVTCLLLGIWVVGADLLLGVLKDKLYGAG
ncbi:MAG: preprotein translocase subunit SecE [Planctomycetota bacterium]